MKSWLRRRVIAPLALCLLVAVGTGGVLRPAPAADTPLRMHHVQVMGTHNSYHRKPSERVVRWLPAWDYSHEPLQSQLSFRGVRQFELDIHYDTGAGEFLVHHVTHFDDHSTCSTLAGCLFEIRVWSGRHPGHLPIFVFLEPKTSDLETGWPGAILPRHDELEDVLRSLFRRSRILTPDDVRGDSTTLKQAVREVGWPRLDRVRGKVVFVLWNTGTHRDVYSDTQTTLQNRLMFVPTDDTAPPISAIVKHDDPNDYAAIRREVGANYIVPTRSDAPFAILDPSAINSQLAQQLLNRCVNDLGLDATQLQNDLLAFISGEELSDEQLNRLDACAELLWDFVPPESVIADSYAARHDTALRSGAHLPRTDHPGLGYTFDDSLIQSFDDYGATMPRGNPARCNPVSAPPNCTARALEDLRGGGGGGCVVERVGLPPLAREGLRAVRDGALRTLPGRRAVRLYYRLSGWIVGPANDGGDDG